MCAICPRLSAASSSAARIARAASIPSSFTPSSSISPYRSDRTPFPSLVKVKMSIFPRIIRVGHVILSVADLPAARHFYVDLLGLNVVHEDDRALYLRGVE